MMRNDFFDDSQQWPLLSLLLNNVFQQWYIQSYCYATVAPVLQVALEIRDRWTDMDGPIRRSLLTLEREEHLIIIVIAIRIR
jgi:hypothetical protein